MSIFSERLKDLRKERNLTQQQLADKLGLNKKQYIYNYENGTEPDFFTLTKIADLFDVSIDYLLGRTDFKKPEHESIVNETQTDIDIIEIINKQPDELKELFYETIKSGALIDLMKSVQLFKDYIMAGPPEFLAEIKARPDFTEQNNMIKQANVLPLVLVQFANLLKEIDPDNDALEKGSPFWPIPYIKDFMSQGTYDPIIKEFEKHGIVINKQ